MDQNPNPETEEPKNWNNLPNELKLKCIEKMNFMTRTCLKISSSNEKAIVDSLKRRYLLDHVEITAKLENSIAFHVKARTNTFGTEFRFLRHCAVPLGPGSGIKEMLENCEIKSLDLVTPNIFKGESPKDWITSNEKYLVHAVRLELRKDQCFEFQLLRNVVNLKEVCVTMIDQEYEKSMETLLEIPQVLHAKLLVIKVAVIHAAPCRNELFWMVLRHLIANEHELGKEVWFEERYDFYSDYLVMFPDARIISYEEKARALLVPTINPNKFILCRPDTRTRGLHMMITDGTGTDDDFEQRMSVRRRTRKEMLARHKAIDMEAPRYKKLIYYGLTRQMRLSVEARMANN